MSSTIDASDDLTFFDGIDEVTDTVTIPDADEVADAHDTTSLVVEEPESSEVVASETISQEIVAEEPEPIVRKPVTKPAPKKASVRAPAAKKTPVIKPKIARSKTALPKEEDAELVDDDSVTEEATPEVVSTKTKGKQPQKSQNDEEVDGKSARGRVPLSEPVASSSSTVKVSKPAPKVVEDEVSFENIEEECEEDQDDEQAEEEAYVKSKQVVAKKTSVSSSQKQANSAQKVSATKQASKSARIPFDTAIEKDAIVGLEYLLAEGDSQSAMYTDILLNLQQKCSFTVTDYQNGDSFTLKAENFLVVLSGEVTTGSKPRLVIDDDEDDCMSFTKDTVLKVISDEAEVCIFDASSLTYEGTPNDFYVAMIDAVQATQ